jgi:DNA polymerase beta
MACKQKIIQHLEILLKDRKAKNEVFKVKAYAKAIKQIQGHNGEIQTAIDVKNLKLGAGITKKVLELLETGVMQDVQEVVQGNQDQFEMAAAVDLFTKVSGIGPVKAKELVEEHGLRSIDELKARCKDLLNDKQRIGLKYYHHFQERIPRAEMDKHNKLITSALEALAIPGLVFQVTGSYRRGAQESGDIDVLISSTENVIGSELLDTVVSNLSEKGYLYEQLAKGDKKYMGVCKLPRHRTYRRLDLIFTSIEQYPFALLYFTGSGDFNVEMRQYALQKGLSLSEYGLKKVSKQTYVKHAFGTEEDIFEYLGLEFVEPKNRKVGAVVPMYDSD